MNTDKILGLAGFIYILSPIDIIPDFIPGVGWLDDATIAIISIGLITGNKKTKQNKKVRT